MVEQQDAALPLAGRICVTVGKPEVETFSTGCCLRLSPYTARSMGGLQSEYQKRDEVSISIPLPQVLFVHKRGRAPRKPWLVTAA